jgi:DNA-binding beta-propeller fold protein YncE
MRNAFSLMITLMLIAFASGCQAPAPANVPARKSASLRVWPQPPAEPRIHYLRTISGPQDWGIVKSFFRRMADALTGKGEDHFVRPTGVAVHDGVLYVADPGARALWILDAAQDRTVNVTEIGSSALVSPVAIAVRPDGAVFVADTLLRKVFLLDREGRLIRVAVDRGLERPAGLAYDPATERLYVVDSAADRIAVYGADGALIRTWGRGGYDDGEFNHPTHLAVDATGTLLVTDALNFRVQAFDRDGRFRWKLGRQGDGSGDLAAPKGLAADREGHVFVVDALFDAVQIFDRDGTFLLAFGERGTQEGQFWLPGGIYIDAQGQIYVADAYNRRVQVFLGVTEKGGGPNK